MLHAGDGGAGGWSGASGGGGVGAAGPLVVLVGPGCCWWRWGPPVVPVVRQVPVGGGVQGVGGVGGEGRYRGVVLAAGWSWRSAVAVVLMVLPVSGGQVDSQGASVCVMARVVSAVVVAVVWVLMGAGLQVSGDRVDSGCFQ